MVLRPTVLALVLGLALSHPMKNQNRPRPMGNRDWNWSDGVGIYDGKSTTIEKHPYLVSILAENQLYCAGAILSSSWLITSADCVFGFSKSDLTVVAGSADGVTGAFYTVRKLVTHPFYNYYSEDYKYDYALVMVEDSFHWSPEVGNVSLPRQEPSVDTNMVVVGYGDTRQMKAKEFHNNYGRSTIKQGSMKWLRNSTCAEYYADYFAWDQSMACAYDKGKTTLCSGDWGDPFVYDRTLYGIFVGGVSEYFCTSLAYPSVLADVEHVTDWILGYTATDNL